MILFNKADLHKFAKEYKDEGGYIMYQVLCVLYKQQLSEFIRSI